MVYKLIKKDQSRLQKQYEFIATDAKEVSQIFTILDDLRIEDGFIIKVDHSERDSFQRSTRIMAIKEAKEKAEYLLNAIDEKLGKPLEIRQIKKQNTFSNVSKNEHLGYLDEIVINRVYDDEVKNQIHYSKIVIKESCYVKFAIE